MDEIATRLDAGVHLVVGADVDDAILGRIVLVRLVGVMLQSLLRPYPPEGMEAVPVSTFVSNPRHEGLQCVAS